MIRRLQAVALDCPDPLRLAEFYAALLGGRVVPDPDDPEWVEVHGFEGTPLAFQRVQDYRPPEWPGQRTPQQMHLDFDVDDIEADEKRVLELGATVLERTDELYPETNWRVYADPAGHPFCLCQH
ncbi:VOC family protein [Streptomyces sp. NRRL F-5053]|uniref:VOC family protein n=1 Tax=Streptomyces sp. NRRL F-5053 TaxID=1463854 RepID=UPI0004C4FF30|nr:VOC family protein [Streptomyces sp. NRRL F-5053]